jgi:hypothetical protein
MIVQYGQYRHTAAGQPNAAQYAGTRRPPAHGSRQRSHAHTLHGHKRSALSPLCSACRLCSPTKKKKQTPRKVEEKDGCMMLISERRKKTDDGMIIIWRWGEALSRDRNLAHSFPCQKGHHRTKSRAGPPTILDSRFLRWKASTYQRKGEEACRRSKNHKEIKLLQPNEPSTSCSLSPVTVRASLTTLFFKEIFYFFKKKIIFFWKIGIPWKIEKKTQVQTDETSKYLHGLVFSGNCCHSKPRRHALTNVRRTTWVVRKKEPVP